MCLQKMLVNVKKRSGQWEMSNLFGRKFKSFSFFLTKAEQKKLLAKISQQVAQMNDVPLISAKSLAFLSLL